MAVLICCDRKILLADCGRLICFERKVLVADKPNEQGGWAADAVNKEATKAG
jgi:hypothetical protein